MTMILVILIGLAAGTLAGIIGFGGSTILLPVLSLQFGPKAAVPIMAIAAIFGNFARVVAWWRVVSWPAVGAYSITAIPAAWFGARTMLSLDPTTLELALGVFFIIMIPLRRWFAVSGLRVTLPGLCIAGAVIGYLTGIVANTGPINTPFFLAHGLTKGAFVGTEATASLAMFLSKAAAFRSFGALPTETITNGIIVGISLMAGTYIAKHLLHSINEAVFDGLMDVLLLVAGIAMIMSALYA
ncbi:MAG: putative membrane protein YfcA [Hyphomicrobiaceae bacterium]|jgi:uncharacterized protein